MEYWESELMTPQEIAKKLRGWSLWKINTLRSRYEIMPEPIVRPNLVIKSEKEPWKFVSRGRLVFYNSYIIEYLKKLDEIKRKEKLSYKKLKDHPEIKKELEKFKLLKETELKIDPRVKSEGFFANFKTALVNLKKIYKWDEDSIYLKFFEQVLIDRTALAKEYYQLNKKMREQALKEARIDQELRRQKEEIGLKLDYLHKIMQLVIEEALEWLKKKIITFEDWFAPIRQMDRER